MSSPSVRRDLNRPSQKNIQERLNQSNFRPNFVRLDSSGEDNYSIKQYTQPKITMCKSCEAHPMSNISCSGMKMNTVFDTATSYVNTAGAYLSEICQYTSANSLARKVSGRSVLNYLNKLGSPSVCDKTSVPFPSEVTTSMPVNNQAPVMSSALSHCIMDALKGRLSNTSLSSPDIKASTTKYESYKPPHIKRIMKGPVLVDPCLTPYNARLLMKSKQCNQSRSVSPEIPHLRKECKESQHGREKLKDSESLKDFVVVQEKTKMPEKQFTQIDAGETDQVSEADSDGSNIPLGTSAMDKNKTNSSRKVEDFNIRNNKKVDGINAVLSKKLEDMEVKCNQVKNVDEKSIIGEEDDVKDWFDHVNSDFKCIPISIKLDNSCSEEEEPLSSSLHNWFSIERDPTVKKEENAEISSQCDNTVFANETDNACRSMLATENSCCDKTVLHQANKDIDSKVPDLENSKQCQGNISVLYVRNMSKKSRPSSKKRRRHKKQQKEGDANENQDKKKSSRKKVNVSIAATSTPNNSKSSNNSIAFILGLEPSHDSSDIEFDSDLHNSSSDWSDSSDFECDREDFVDGFDESQNWMSDIMCPVNFQITCSLVNSQEIPSTTSSHLDDINLSWKVNLAMSPKQSRKRNSDKKVHFASAEHLATVHPMVTWSHAYQAARKGPWEEYARDRGRFQRRITDLQRTLDPVLDPGHRETVFNQRYNKNAL